VAMPLMMAMMTEAMAEMTASMAWAMAEMMEPCAGRQRGAQAARAAAHAPWWFRGGYVGGGGDGERWLAARLCEYRPPPARRAFLYPRRRGEFLRGAGDASRKE
jgi:hypothetical protein